VLASAGSALAGVYDAWAHKMELVFNGYVGTSTLTDFPVLVQLNPSKVRHHRLKPVACPSTEVD